LPDRTSAGFRFLTARPASLFFTMTKCFRHVVALALGFLLSLVTASAAEAPAVAHEAAHGLPQAAVPLFHLGPFVMTNSMLLSWVVALGLIIVAQLATRRMALVPAGLQNFVEWLVESLYTFLEDILGRELVKKSFWFFATIFIFILFNNWFGLLPGVGTIGRGEPAEGGMPLGLAEVTDPFLRGGNADLNLTAAMSLIFFVLWCVWAVQTQGFVGVIKHLFGVQTDATGLMKLFMIVVFLGVGVLEVISIAFRPVALTFRLYGNIFAGENILESMIKLIPWLGPVLPVPFYFLELLVGLVQALVFCLLTAVFTATICEHPEAETGKAAEAH